MLAHWIRDTLKSRRGLFALLALGFLILAGEIAVNAAGDATSHPEGEPICCKPGDMTPPGELANKIPPGGLHSPYPDYAELAKDKELVKQFRLPGCNECHGGGGGGGFCPALSQGVWFWGNTDDVLFRLIALGTAGLEKQGFVRLQWGSVHGPMPPMAVSIKSSDQLWKIIAFIRSINPPGTNPPEKLVPAKMAPAGETK
jgi:mono/diheme cytochrome c family protein